MTELISVSDTMYGDSIRRVHRCRTDTGYYFSRMFKKEVGKSPADYITEKGIERARQLLVSTNLPIQDISDCLQFCSRSYFSTVFQQLPSVSPS